MAAEIGSLGVLLSADTANFEQSLSKAAATAEREMARTERANKKAAVEADRFIAVIQRQVDTFGLSGTALMRYEANLKGASDRAGPLLDKLDQMRAAQAAASAATDASATAGARFVASLGEQVATYGKSANELLALKAAQLGVTDSAAGLIAQLDRLQAVEREAAAATQAAARSTAEQIANERAAAQSKQSFIDSLQRESEAIGRTRSELLTLKAAQLGIGDSAAPLIAQLERQQVAERAKAAAQQASARAAQEAAAAERQAAQTKQSFLDALEREAGAIGKTRAELLTLRAAELGVGDAATANIAKINAASGALNRYGVSAGQTTAAFRMLPAQITDVVTQLAGGANPLLVLIQQGGQVKDSFGGLGATFDALKTYINPVTVAVGALAVGIGGLAYAFGSGSEESAKLGRSLQLTGGYAGITAGQFEGMARSIADGANASIGSAKDILQGLVESGRFSGETLRTAGVTATQFARATGESADAVVQKFVSMADNVGSAAEGLNRQYHFLTAAQLEEIKTLDEQGRHQEALKATLDALSERVGAASQNLGFFARAWAAAGRAASEAIDKMKAIGRVQTPEEALGDVEARLRALNSSRTSGNPLADAVTGRRDALKETLTFQQSVMRNEVAIAQVSQQNEARRLQVEEARLRLNKELESTKTRQQKREDELAKANALIDSAGGTAEQRARLVANINEKYKDPKGPKGPSAATLAGRENAQDKASLGIDLAEIKAQLDDRNNAYRAADAILSAQRQAGLVDEAAYYDRKRDLISASTASTIAALDQEEARLKAQKYNDKDPGAALKRIDDQKRLVAIVRERSKVEADAATQTQVLGIQEQAAQTARVKGYLDARNAAQDYLDTLKRTQDRAVEAFGQGDKERSRVAARQQIEDKYDQQRRQLENNRRLLEGLKDKDGNSQFNGDARAKYDQELALLKEYLPQALAEWDDYYARITAAERNWTNGATRALANYSDQAANAAAYAERFTTGSLGQLEDAVAKFSRTGKLNLGSLWQFMADEFIRQQARMAIASATGGQGGLFGSLISAVGSYFGVSGTPQRGGYEGAGLTGDFARADRAIPLAVGTNYVPYDGMPAVLHKGEAVVPAAFNPAAGGVAPGVGGDLVVNIHNNAGAEVQARETRQPDGRRTLEIFVERAKQAVVQDIRAGGDVASSLQGTYGLNRAAGVSR